MYGSISRWHIKEGSSGSWKSSWPRWCETARRLDWRCTSTGLTRIPANTGSLVSSRAGRRIRANSDLPDTAAGYQQLRGLMDADPEWHDGEVIASG